MALGIGDVIDGKYKILRLLGEGGMGAVYEGENTRIHRRVAIKVLHADVASSDEAMTRFEREAQAAGRIGSEHIVEVLDLGDLPGGERYMVMEFLEGEALSTRIGHGRMAPRTIATLMVDMLEGLRAAHDAGIVHRDLKPDNVFLLSNRGGKADFVKIVDFGISKFNTMGGEFSMTRTGAVMGTPYYMAPEQAKGGKAVDHRVDLYAVGVILYQAVVGHVPFQAETFNELLFKIVLETPPPLQERVPGIDPDFVNLVNKAMARDPDHRYQTAPEFQEALRAWLGGAHIPADLTIHAGTPHGFDKTALPGPGMQTPGFGSIAARTGAVGTPAAPAGFPNQTTPGTWESSAAAGSNAAAPEVPVKKGPPMALIAAAAVLVLGGIGAAVAMSGGGEADAAAQAVEEEAAKVKLEDERKAALADLEAEKEKAREAREKADAARLEAEANKKRLEDEARAAATARTAPSAAPAARPSAARPAPAAAPRPAAAPAPAPAPDPAKSGGRIITTDL